MAINKSDLRQSIIRSYQNMIANRASFNSDSHTEADNLIAGINTQVTPPFNITPNEPSDLIVNVATNKVSNSETSIRHASPAISKLFPTFSSGTVTFPASSGGNITVSPTILPAPILTLAPGEFKLALIECDKLGNLSVTLGTAGASEVLAGFPKINTKKFQIGLIVLTNTAGTIDAISGSKIIQLSGGGSGGGVTTEELIFNDNQTVAADVTEFLIDSADNQAFKCEYSIQRQREGLEDTAFYTNLGTAFNSSIISLDIQSDGKILAGGNFNQFNSNTRNSLVRLNSDGTEDTAFYANLGTAFNDIVYTIKIQSDGKILIGGLFNVFNGNTCNRLVRLNSDGTEDTAFYTNLGTAFLQTIRSLDIQSDGKILVGGTFITFNGNTRNRLVRLNSDGTEDTAFYANLGTAFNSTINSLYVQSDGKILVGGSFDVFNGNVRNRLVRLNSDGTEDTAFYANLGTAFDSNINSLDIQSDGKILVGGGFAVFNGNTRNSLVRLNSDGTEDTAFYANLGTASNGNINSLDIQSDGKILVGGGFTAFNGNVRRGIVRLNSDGTEDTAFYANLGAAFNTAINSLYVQSDGKILIGGVFNLFDNITRNYLVRLDTVLYIDLMEQGSFSGLYRSLSSVWSLNGQTFTGDNAGVTFSITSGGQVQYVSTNTGTDVNLLKFIIFNL